MLSWHRSLLKYINRYLITKVKQFLRGSNTDFPQWMTVGWCLFNVYYINE